MCACVNINMGFCISELDIIRLMITVTFHIGVGKTHGRKGTRAHETKR